MNTDQQRLFEKMVTHKHRMTEKKDYVRGYNEALEKAAQIVEAIWDNGLQGAHGGEQTNRCAMFIRGMTLPGNED